MHMGDTKGSKMSLRDDILALIDSTDEIITIGQWGGKRIKVKSLTAGQRYSMIERCTDKSGMKLDGKKFYINTCIACAYDPETDKPIFTEADFDAVSNKSAAAVELIVQTANRLNGLGDIQVQEMEKN